MKAIQREILGYIDLIAATLRQMTDDFIYGAGFSRHDLRRKRSRNALCGGLSDSAGRASELPDSETRMRGRGKRALLRGRSGFPMA